MTERFWCNNYEQVGNAGDHECPSKEYRKPPARFLGWLREAYVHEGPLCFAAIKEGWEHFVGSPVPIALIDRALHLLMDTGEVTCDTIRYPPTYRPTGSDADLRAAVGLTKHLETAVKLATERKWSKVEL